MAVLAPPPETSLWRKVPNGRSAGPEVAGAERRRKKPSAERGESSAAGKSRVEAEQPRAVAGSRRARGRKSPPSSGDGAAAACAEPERGAGAEAEPGAGPWPPCRTSTSSSGSSTRTSKVRGGGGRGEGKARPRRPPPRVGRGLHWAPRCAAGMGGEGARPSPPVWGRSALRPSRTPNCGSSPARSAPRPAHGAPPRRDSGGALGGNGDHVCFNGEGGVQLLLNGGCSHRNAGGGPRIKGVCKLGGGGANLGYGREFPYWRGGGSLYWGREERSYIGGRGRGDWGFL